MSEKLPQAVAAAPAEGVRKGTSGPQALAALRNCSSLSGSGSRGSPRGVVGETLLEEAGETLLEDPVGGAGWGAHVSRKLYASSATGVVGLR